MLQAVGALGTPAITTRGFGEKEVIDLTHWMCDILEDVNDQLVINSVRSKVSELCKRFPVYGN